MKTKYIQDYGYFDAEEGCFLITSEPPRKWRNILYNQWGENEFYAEATHIGDGTSRYMDGVGNTVRVSGYDSKFLYLRDEETGVVFNPAGMPAATPVEDRLVKIHPSKTEISSWYQGLNVSHRIFVPVDATAEVWTLTLTNTTGQSRRVSAFAYSSFDLGGVDREYKPFGADKYSEILPELGTVIVVNRAHGVPTDRNVAFVSALSHYHAGCGLRGNFTRNDYGFGNPKIVFGWDCDNEAGYDWNPAGIVQCKVEIPAGSTVRIDFLVGICTGTEEIRALRARFTPEAIDAAAALQAGREKARAESYWVDTGNLQRDALFNIFVKKHVYSYLMDKGGVRDNLQNVNALVFSDPETARANILKCLTAQKPDGSSLHSWRPLNRRQYSDKPAWMLQTVPWYVQETGDTSILEEKIPFFESAETGTVLEHLQRSYRWLSTDLGRRGLCRQHFADWNDNLEPSEKTGERESVMVSQQLCAGLLEVAGLASFIGEEAIQQECLHLHQTMAETLNRSAWDGAWYVRTICEDGYCLGSSKNAEAKIFVNTQSWAVMGGVAGHERLLQCMESVDKYIEKPEGYAVADPPCSTFDERVGRFTTLMPNNVENGGCYNHAAGFKCVADCLLGRAEEAWRTLVKVAPDGPHLPISVSGAEPFAFINHYTRVATGLGRGGYAWHTGTAAWFAVALIEFILGARRGYNGLVISPCLTASVPVAKMTRKFRGTTYHITLDNREGRKTGVRELRLDGEVIAGNVLPLSSQPSHEVHVII